MADAGAMHPQPHLAAYDPHSATVLVGPRKKRFVVKKDLLARHSESFKVALAGSSKESQEWIITAPNVEPLIFEFFVHWMHHEAFPTVSNAPTRLLNKWDVKDADIVKTGNLIKLYVLGELYGIEALRLLALEDLLWFMDLDTTGLPNSDQVSYAYENLPSESALLRLLVDLYGQYVSENTWKDGDADDLPSPFIVAVLRRLSLYARHELENNAELELCDYHDHEDAREREQCSSR
ncbi:hypothetical protein C7974DRAFT_410379 [Boeremia exigua]|uniref:uncharacterized protein n=1 Tax=Boeremia exigua TaxID=749465 RepID=UPI001E8EDC2E|nr:uncharacterized protein C7974DRAFT_410379 [Boeremia exigua]KAH6639405.1 hypothetical protein C7974DRAFT_410379 [Boeremia exigua]